MTFKVREEILQLQKKIFILKKLYECFFTSISVSCTYHYKSSFVKLWYSFNYYIQHYIVFIAIFLLYLCRSKKYFVNQNYGGPAIQISYCMFYFCLNYKIICHHEQNLLILFFRKFMFVCFKQYPFFFHQHVELLSMFHMCF